MKEIQIPDQVEKLLDLDKGLRKRDLVAEIVKRYSQDFFDTVNLVFDLCAMEEIRFYLICSIFETVEDVDLTTIMGLNLITLKIMILNFYVEKIPGFDFEHHDGEFSVCLNYYRGQFLPDFSKLNFKLRTFALVGCELEDLRGLPKDLVRLDIISSNFKSLKGCVYGLEELTLYDCYRFRSFDGFVDTISDLAIDSQLERQLFRESALKLDKLKKEIKVSVISNKS